MPLLRVLGHQARVFEDLRNVVSFERVIVMAPTKATCVNIERSVRATDLPRTLLLRECGPQLDQAIANLHQGGFGVVAGTGTGKTAGIRHLCKQVLGSDLNVDIVTSEHAATAATRKANVLVMTAGVGLNWLKDGRIGRRDLLVFDEVHLTSGQLEMVMALAKRSGCTFVWMSATVDPTRYQEYLEAHSVVRCEVFDPAKRAQVRVVQPQEVQTARGMQPEKLRATLERFLKEQLETFIQQERCVAVFVPTRQDAEDLSKLYQDVPGLHAGFYHGGEPAEKLRPYLTGEIQRPFVVFMTAAGSSSLNIRGLDTVVIVDSQYKEVVENGFKIFKEVTLSANELLQMAGRVNGRAKNGQVFIMSPKDIDFHELRPSLPDFVLGGELHDLVFTTARLGIDARELDLIGELDPDAYARVLQRYIDRKLVSQGRAGQLALTSAGERVEALPVVPAWGEMVTVAQDVADMDLLKVFAVCACIGQLRDLHVRDWKREGLLFSSSDHLTGYNIVRAMLAEFGAVRTGRGGVQEYDIAKQKGGATGTKFKSGMDRYYQAARSRGIMAKGVLQVMQRLSSLFYELGFKQLPSPQEFPEVTFRSPLHDSFVMVLAMCQSLDFVQRQYHAEFGQVFVNTYGVIGEIESVLGTIRLWNDKRGQRRASADGTRIPEELQRQFASRRLEPVELRGDDRVRMRVDHVFAGQVVHTSYEEVPTGQVDSAIVADLQRLHQLELEQAARRAAEPQPASAVYGFADRLTDWDDVLRLARR